MDIIEKNGSFVYGDYVLTPCKNIENQKTSYWLSKKGCTLAAYCFTPICKADLTPKEMKKHIEGTIDWFERKLKK